MKYFLAVLLIMSLSFSVKLDKEDLYVPDDLVAELWAESPMFYNPTNMDVDIKGRIWVTEAVNYRNFNNDSNKTLHHSKGDRVMILEDTDNDGRADKSKIFVEDKDLVSPVGIAVIGNKVIVSCSPNLIVYTDENGDDVPDQKEIFLTGFGGLDHDHSLHAVYAGPDGRWYFNVGNAGPHVVKDKSGFTLRSGSIYTGGSPYNNKNQGNMRSDDGKVWVGGLALRIDPNGKGLTVMGHNFRNSYEVIPDSYGQLWQNDNDDQVVACRASWLMEGGNAGFFSQDGTRYWQADQRPGQEIFDAHWHQDNPGVMPAGCNTGAGAPTGVTVIESDALGEKYLGMFLSADAGRNVVFGFRPTLKGAGFEMGKPENLITSLKKDNQRYVWNDTAFDRQKEMWFRPSDVTIGTDGAIYVADWYDPVVGGHQMRDRKGYGRIYRISPRNKKLTKPVYDLSSVAGQIEVLKSPAINVRNTGFALLRAQGDKLSEEVSELVKERNPYIRARAIWLLSQLGEKGRSKVNALLDDKDERIRAVAYKSLLASGADVLPLASKMADDPSAFVRRELAASLRDVEGSGDIVGKLIRSYPGGDRWYLETLGAAMDKDAAGYYAYAKDIFAKGRSPLEWNREMAEIAWRLHPVEALKDLEMRAGSAGLDAGARMQALNAIAFINDAAAANAMLGLSKSSLKDVAEQSMYWLSFRQTNDWYSLLDWSTIDLNTAYQRKLANMKVLSPFVLDSSLSFDERRYRADAMARDTIGGQMLIGMAAENQLDRAMKVYLGKKIFDNPDPVVRVQAGKYFKKPGNDIQYSIERVASLKSDPAKGKVLFNTYCATCHKFSGAGRSVGPDLTDIKNKFDKISLLDAIVNPSAAIVFGYEPWLINVKGGESLYGFIISENKNTLVLKDVAGISHNIAAANIIKKEKQKGSLMPDPATNKMSEKQLADVVGYLSQK
ncbi:MAG TPA: PVC-type heme-binding CxxCH protein [Chitinophagaceae bacterium]|nr:PVC-type heme-binding CxxCH protein [Chitinophagaceae bacterium]